MCRDIIVCLLLVVVLCRGVWFRAGGTECAALGSVHDVWLSASTTAVVLAMFEVQGWSRGGLRYRRAGRVEHWRAGGETPT